MSEAFTPFEIGVLRIIAVALEEKMDAAIARVQHEDSATASGRAEVIRISKEIVTIDDAQSKVTANMKAARS